MKTITFFLIVFCSAVAMSQTENEGEIQINQTQLDDTYRTGETIAVNAAVQGDLVIAGGTLIVNDSINGDLTAAGGELILNGYIADDVRTAVGKATIDSEIGDDLVIFGGEVIIAKNTVIHGNVKCYAGNVQIYGEVLGGLDIKGGDVLIDGNIREASKIAAEEITIGTNAKFYKEVEYWHSEGEMDFKDALVDTQASFNEDLKGEQSQLSLTNFGTNSIKLWIFYLLSALVAILFLHALFRNAFANTAHEFEGNWLKSFGFGLLYLIGVPLVIIIALFIAIGIPLTLFVTAIFIFSLLFGHYIAALLLVYYLKYKKDKQWGFWSITLLALLVTVLLRLLTMIPYAGIALSIVVIAITYGALTLGAFRSKKDLIKN
ncbi:MAG: hypothetical protein ABJM06_04020 [Gilvibacter sp.]